MQWFLARDWFVYFQFDSKLYKQNMPEYWEIQLRAIHYSVATTCTQSIRSRWRMRVRTKENLLCWNYCSETEIYGKYWNLHDNILFGANLQMLMDGRGWEEYFCVTYEMWWTTTIPTHLDKPLDRSSEDETNLDFGGGNRPNNNTILFICIHCCE